SLHAVLREARMAEVVSERTRGRTTLDDRNGPRRMVVEFRQTDFGTKRSARLLDEEARELENFEHLRRGLDELRVIERAGIDDDIPLVGALILFQVLRVLGIDGGRNDFILIDEHEGFLHDTLVGDRDGDGSEFERRIEGERDEIAIRSRNEVITRPLMRKIEVLAL